jgi:hypothetical protein
MSMINVYFNSSEGQSSGRDFTDMGKALEFAETIWRDGPTYTDSRATLVDSDGVFMLRRLKFFNGDLVSYEVQRDGRMVELMKGKADAD